MATVNANDVRIPLGAREALARHEEVTVLNHDRPVYVIVNSEDRRRPESIRGRRLDEALNILSTAPMPDPLFGDDMEAVLGLVGASPEDPWAHS